MLCRNLISLFAFCLLLLFPSVASGRTVYCSSSAGDDSNPGTRSRPVRTIARAVRMGSDVRLRRGDVFYEQINVKGVDIGPYGESGNLPQVSGLKIPLKYARWERGAVDGSGQWHPAANGNVWRLSLLESVNFAGVDTHGKPSLLNNVGAVVNISTGSLNDSRKMPSLADLSTDFDFYQPADPTRGIKLTDLNYIYLYLTSNPATLPLGFTCGLNGVTAENSRISGIDVVYWGRHGFSIGSDVTVEDCRVDGIGGATSLSATHGWCVLGNGIECWVTTPGQSNITVRNCMVSRCYDCGLTIQGHYNEPIPVHDALFTGNYVTHCGQAWEGELNSDSGADCQFYNCSVSGNYFIDNGRDTGFRYVEKGRSKYCQLLSYNLHPSDLLVADNLMADADYLCCNRTSDNLFNPFKLRGNTVYIIRGQYLLVDARSSLRVKVPLADEYPDAKALTRATSDAIARYRMLSSDTTTRFVIVDSATSPEIEQARRKARTLFNQH